MDQDIIGKCWQCGHPLSTADYGRETSCLGCGKATRVCRNCAHYARGRPNDCEEPMAEPVMEKDRANFCEWFEPASEPTQNTTSNTATDLLEAAEKLFK